MGACGNTAASGEQPSYRRVCSILSLYEAKKGVDRRLLLGVVTLPPPRMLSRCPHSSTNKRHQHVDTTVEPVYSRYMSNDALSQAAARYFAARDRMFARNTKANRKACRQLARAYDAAQDAAEQDSTRNWTR